MIPVEELTYGIDYKLNSLSNLKNRSIFLEDKILALNSARILLVKQKIGPNNNYTLGFDAFKKRYQDLENLVVPFNQKVLKPELEDENLNKWSATIDFPDYMFYVDSYVLADKGLCKSRKIRVNNDLTKHGDVQRFLADYNYVPSFEWKETFSTLSNGNLEIYTDGTFTPTGIYMSYLRYPKEIDSEGYERLDGKQSTNSDSDLNYYLKDELLNLAVIELAKITENIPAVQLTQDSKKFEE